MLFWASITFPHQECHNYDYNQSKDFDEVMSIVQVKIGKLGVKDVLLDREFGID